MIKRMTKSTAFSFLALSSMLVTAMPAAQANSETRHTLVLPGTCVFSDVTTDLAKSATVTDNGTATVTFSHNTLILTSNNPNAVAAAIVTASIPNIGLTNTPIPQGTLTFTADKTDSEYSNEYEIVGFYQSGKEVLFKSGSLPKGIKNFSVNTVRANKGQLLAVSFLYAGGVEVGGTVVVSNFAINGIPANGFDLTNPQTCSPYVTQIIEEY
jgi:hypothetical protein